MTNSPLLPFTLTKNFHFIFFYSFIFFIFIFILAGERLKERITTNIKLLKNVFDSPSFLLQR